MKIGDIVDSRYVLDAKWRVHYGERDRAMVYEFYDLVTGKTLRLTWFGLLERFRR